MSESNSTGGVSWLDTLIKSPKSIAGWGGMLVAVGTFVETNATDSVTGWALAGASALTSLLTIVLPALSSSAGK